MSTSANADERRIDITPGLGNVPAQLLNMPCSRFYIEFLRVSSEGLSVAQTTRIKNHATFKVDFSETIRMPTRTVTRMIFGTRINMEVDTTSESIGSQNRTNRFSPGDLFLDLREYPGESNSTCRTIELPLAQGIKLGHLLEAFMRYGVHHFSFNCINGKYYGCRDFM